MIENTLHTDYRFFLSYPDEGQVQVYPVNRSIEFAFTREDEYRYYRKELSTSLVFTNDQRNDVNDFDAIYAHDRSPDSCESLPLQIQRLCNDEWILYFEGELNVVDMDFNPESCRVECPVRTVDEWTCIDDQFKEEVNVLDGTLPVAAKPLKGQYERITLTCGDLFSCTNSIETPLTTGLSGTGVVTIDPNDQWTLEYHFAQTGASFQNATTTYIREIVNATSSPGIGWVEVDTDVWARPVEMVKEFERSSSAEYEYSANPVFPEDPLDNGRRFADVVDALFSECDINIVSDFYGINPDSTAPDNEFYQRAADECQNIIIYQKTDIKRPNADNPAFILPLTIEAMFLHMKLVHNVYPFFDADGNLRFEHYTYRNEEYMLDLTQDSLRKYLRGKHQYSYDLDKLPKKEAWRFMDEFNDVDFKGLPITYSGCFTSRDNDTVDFAMNYLTTHIAAIAANPDNVEDDGMVWVACDENDFIIFDEGNRSGTIKINAPLSLANLIPNFHTVGRPQRLGKVNGEQTVLQSEPVRDQPTITVKLCCEDIGTFDPNDLVKTQLGWGRVEDATLTVPYGKIELNTKHYA